MRGQSHLLDDVTVLADLERIRALFLALVALLPSLILAFWHIQNYPFAGTTLLTASKAPS